MLWTIAPSVSVGQSRLQFLDHFLEPSRLNVDNNYCHVYSNGMNDVLRPFQTREFLLAELEAAAADLLGRAGPSSVDGRVAAVPDGRTLRYYQSSGIMDRPVRYDGRSAVYGYKSLLQAVCTKLLQSSGYSLAQVQRALSGATAARLEEALIDALGEQPSQPEPEPEPAPPESEIVRLLSVEVAPGVVVTIDPRVHADPEVVIRRIQLTLNQRDAQ